MGDSNVNTPALRNWLQRGGVHAKACTWSVRAHLSFGTSQALVMTEDRSCGAYCDRIARRSCMTTVCGTPEFWKLVLSSETVM